MTPRPGCSLHKPSQSQPSRVSGSLSAFGCLSGLSATKCQDTLGRSTCACGGGWRLCDTGSARRVRRGAGHGEAVREDLQRHRPASLPRPCHACHASAPAARDAMSPRPAGFVRRAGMPLWFLLAAGQHPHAGAPVHRRGRSGRYRFARRGGPEPAEGAATITAGPGRTVPCKRECVYRCTTCTLPERLQRPGPSAGIYYCQGCASAAEGLMHALRRV